MNFLNDLLDSILCFLKLRKTTRAAADAVEGDAIIAQADREAAEMREAAELAEARKRLDTDPSGVPLVAAPAQPVPPPAPVASVTQPTVNAVQPIAATPPSTTSATTAPTIVAVPTLPANRPN